MAVEERFWRSPALVAELIPFLDVASTLALATVQPLVLDLLQRRFMWKNLMRRSKIGLRNDYGVTNEDDKREVLEMVSILKMVEDPKPLLLDLLHHICQLHPADPENPEDPEDPESPERCVILSCSLHPGDHMVDQVEFKLLEHAEVAIGTVLQKVEEFEYHTFNENLSTTLAFAQALTDRIVRQKAPLRSAAMKKVLLLSNIGITATLLQNAEEWYIEEFYLQRDFGEEGWSWLAEGLQRAGIGRVDKIYLSREVMERAKRSDLKAVWEATAGTWWLQEHSQGPLPKDWDEWQDWRIMFSQIPPSEDDIFFGGLNLEEEEFEDEWMKIEELLDRASEGGKVELK